MIDDDIQRRLDAIRSVAADERNNLILQRTQWASFKSREEATTAASAACPELPWEKIFAALEAAGLVAFNIGHDPQS